MSSHLKAPPVKPSQVKSSQVILSHLNSSRVISRHLKSSQVLSNHLKSSQVISSHLKSSQIMSCHLKTSQPPGNWRCLSPQGRHYDNVLIRAPRRQLRGQVLRAQKVAWESMATSAQSHDAASCEVRTIGTGRRGRNGTIA